MVTTQKATGRASSMPMGLCLGACVSIAITLLSIWILAKMLDAGMLSWERTGYGVMILLIVSAFFGTITSKVKIKRRTAMVCTLSGLIYFGILLSITALFFGGQYEAVGETAMLILAGSGTAGLVGETRKKGGQRKRKRHH